MGALKATVIVVLLNSVLFMGEIFQIVKQMTRIHYRPNLFALKNLVIAPFCEEFIYRVCLINLSIESKAFTPTEAVLVLPVFFAISHLHHVIMQRKNPGFNYTKAFLVALFKLMYTQVFGIYGGFVYIWTGSIWPAFALHAHCNFFGFPSFQNFFERDYMLTDRIIAGILYVLGLVLFLW
jgi:membrane protease YdiL (CAAX protease family)